jgi:hypothetical protein
MGGAFWKVYDHVQSLCGGIGFVIQKLDSCDSIDEESSCPLTEQIDVFVTWPPVELKPLCKLRKLSLEEPPDIVVDNRCSTM